MQICPKMTVFSSWVILCMDRSRYLEYFEVIQQYFTITTLCYFICLLRTSLSYKIINKSNHSFFISPSPTPPKKTVKTKTTVRTPCQQFASRAINHLIITNLLHEYLLAESGFKQRRNKNQPRSKSFETESRQLTMGQSCHLPFWLHSTIAFP